MRFGSLAGEPPIPSRGERALAYTVPAIMESSDPTSATVHDTLIAAIHAGELVTLRFRSGVSAVVEPHLYGQRDGRARVLVYAYGAPPAGATSAWQFVDVAGLADVARWTGHTFQKRPIPPEYDAP